MARAAVALIWRWLQPAWARGDDLEAREQMALASTLAGLAFTRANVGNVHAIAHQLGGRYHTPHGLANAILLPSVLRFGLDASSGPLAALARHLTLGDAHDGDEALALRFIDGVQALNDAIGIPRTLAALNEADIPELAQAACWEADTHYPVPRRMSPQACEALLRGVLAPADAPLAASKPVAKRAAARRPAAKQAAPRKTAARP
jgi:alcohol dehydrogenase class IV